MHAKCADLGATQAKRRRRQRLTRGDGHAPGAGTTLRPFGPRRPRRGPGPWNPPRQLAATMASATTRRAHEPAILPAHYR